MIKLNKQLEECSQGGKNECSLLRDKIKLEEEKKPLMFSLLLIWVSESLGTFFDNSKLYGEKIALF